MLLGDVKICVEPRGNSRASSPYVEEKRRRGEITLFVINFQDEVVRVKNCQRAVGIQGII